MYAQEPQEDTSSKPHPGSLPGETKSNLPARPRPRGGLRFPLWILAVSAGLGAGLVAGLAGETIGRAIPPQVVLPPDFAQMGPYQKNAVNSMATVEAVRVAERKKSAAVYGLLGTLLALSLGLTAGLSAGSPKTGFTASLIGGAIGAAVGAGISWVVVPLFFQYQDPETNGLLALFLTHCAIFLGVGAASGLAFGLGLKDSSLLARALVGGLLGALLASFVFETGCSLAFPMMRTYQPLPAEPLPRILAHLCVGILVSLGAGLAAGAPRVREVSPKATKVPWYVVS